MISLSFSLFLGLAPRPSAAQENVVKEISQVGAALTENHNLSEADPAAPAEVLGSPVFSVPCFAPTPEQLALFRALPPRTRHGRKDGPPLSMIFLGDKADIVAALREAKWAPVPRDWPLSFAEGAGQLLSAHRITRFPP